MACWPEQNSRDFCCVLVKVGSTLLVDTPALREKAQMHSRPRYSKRGTASRSMAVLALLCVLGIVALLLQPSVTRALSKAADFGAAPPTIPG